MPASKLKTPEPRALRQALEAEALSWCWITPFAHDQMAKGHGVDCIRLVQAVGEACRVLTVDPALAAQFMPYPRAPRGREIVRAADLFLTRLANGVRPDTGDLVLLRSHKTEPQHFGIVTRGGRMMIHADARVPTRDRPQGRGVVEISLWSWERQVFRAWRYPGLQAAIDRAGGEA